MAVSIILIHSCELYVPSVFDIVLEEMGEGGILLYTPPLFKVGSSHLLMAMQMEMGAYSVKTTASFAAKEL